MVWVTGCIVLCCLLPLVLSDGGYSKEEPSMPFQEGGYPKETPPMPFQDSGYLKETPPMPFQESGYPKETPTMSFQDSGYPKEAPSKPFQEGATTKDNSNDIPKSAVSSSGPGSAGGSKGADGYTSTAVYNYGGGYLPGYTSYYYGYPVSTDYVSRYYGPGAVPVVMHDGTLAYTLEVAAARAAHLAALEKAKALWFGKMDDGSYDIYKYGDFNYGVSSGSATYHQSTGAGPFGGSQDPWQVSKVYGAPPVTASDPWQVSKAYGAPLVTGSDPWQLNKPYSGPLASVTVLPSGYLADTPVIASARAAHYQALVAAQHAAEKARAQAWTQWD